MPVRSMTGYGEQSVLTDHWEISVRIKTLNHRHLDPRVSGLDRYPSLNLKVRDILQKSFDRGRIDLDVELKRTRQTPTLKFDPELAKQYRAELKNFSEMLDLKQEPTLEFLLSMEGVTERVMVEEDTLWTTIEPALLQSIEQVQQMRTMEGDRLEQEFHQFVGELKTITGTIGERMPELKEGFRQRLLERIEALNGNVTIDEGRIEEEVVLFVERSDISEEIARLHSHFEATNTALKSDKPAGKTLDFLAQEMGREINTIGAKSKDASVSHNVIDMKSVLEKFREQVRNIE